MVRAGDESARRGGRVPGCGGQRASLRARLITASRSTDFGDQGREPGDRVAGRAFPLRGGHQAQVPGRDGDRRRPGAARRAPACRSRRGRRAGSPRAARSRPGSRSPRRGAPPGRRTRTPTPGRRPTGPAPRRPRPARPGHSSSCATCAVDPSAVAPRPSNRPMTPSTTAMSAPARAVREQRRDPCPRRTAPGPGSGPGARSRAHGSRGRCSPGRPCARTRPARAPRSAAISPVATVVLPCPDAGAATTRRGTFTTRCPSGPSGRRPSGA